MSQPALLPEPQAAFETLQNNVSNNVFFQKLAQHGFAPANEKEAGELLDLAGKLRVVDQTTKAAGDSQSDFSQASAALDNVMSVRGLENPVKSAAAYEEQEALSAYANQLANHPDLYNAVLSVKQAQADVVAKQLGIPVSA